MSETNETKADNSAEETPIPENPLPEICLPDISLEPEEPLDEEQEPNSAQSLLPNDDITAPAHTPETLRARFHPEEKKLLSTENISAHLEVPDDVSKAKKKEQDHISLQYSECAIDQTWGEWMYQLPGTAWNKVCLFADLQWRWSKRLVGYTHLPEWLKDNRFLLSRHRLPTYSFTGCIFSAFRLHTETGNIWTHLIGSLLTISFAIYCFASRLYKLSWVEQLVYAVFFLSASMCMGFSCMFHTVLNHSPKMFKLFSRLDYSGISLLVVGSYVPWLYYAFFCNPVCYIVYTTVVCLIGGVGVVVSLWEKFDQPKYRTFRAGVFLTMGLSAVIPGVHYAVLYGWQIALQRASLGWMILMGCIYVTGTMMYMLQIPERFCPGKFDLWFQSHQIFHVFILIAIFVHYHGISLLEFQHSEMRLNHTLCSYNIRNFTDTDYHDKLMTARLGD